MSCHQWGYWIVWCWGMVGNVFVISRVLLLGGCEPRETMFFFPVGWVVTGGQLMVVAWAMPVVMHAAAWSNVINSRSLHFRSRISLVRGSSSQHRYEPTQNKVNCLGKNQHQRNGWICETWELPTWARSLHKKLRVAGEYSRVRGGRHYCGTSCPAKPRKLTV